MVLVPMLVLARRFSSLTAVLALAAVLVPAGGARSHDTVLPTLYVEYTINCVFTITDDDGKRVTSIAPGTYQIHVTTPLVFSEVDLSGIHDMTACKGFVQFELSGPGVDLTSTLQDGDDDDDDLKATFRASSTYTARDLNQPSVARVVFSTTATGSPVAPASPYKPSTSPTKSTASTDIVGSAVKSSAPFRGTLNATVSAAGKLTLTFKGKNVDKLSAGRYSVKIVDRSKKAGFVLQQLHKSAITLTKSAFVGKSSGNVTMKPGQWLYSRGGGQAHYFLVFGG
jgi:hypothetical protein